ncbi:hypothetical protein [Nonomuraea aridisoli]|uniref:Uncharacterized protein n=1 Tax=Nonomuraea aridisoli TaxID=2070368 RepID=A0A2W2DK35_9ACTN|nr:hypothetical protein [Nonomuraea aridisoli]PZG10751.1 hypothetical protein C1J01_35730 [Nonomuraea aridisoli]
MTRSEFDDIRAFLADDTAEAGDVLAVARTLVDDLEHSHLREAILRTHYLRLLTAARATMAAELLGAPDPLAFVRHELSTRGQLPEDGETAERILSDARAAAELLASLENPPQRRPRELRLRRCVSTGRRLPH